MGETNSISRRPVRGEMFIDGNGQQLLLRSEGRKSTWVVGLICLPLLERRGRLLAFTAMNISLPTE